MRCRFKHDFQGRVQHLERAQKHEANVRAKLLEIEMQKAQRIIAKPASSVKRVSK